MSDNNGTKPPINRHHYFGACPECGETDGYLNVRQSHWYLCETHQTRWLAGSGLFSSWHEENDEVWANNVKRLIDYREVEPLPQIEPRPEDIEPV